MHRYFFASLLFTLGALNVLSKDSSNYSRTYDELIMAYQKLAINYATAELDTFGTSDVGRPLHLFKISLDQDFQPTPLEKRNKAYLLINNGIHAGESCGIDASIELATELLQHSTKYSWLKNITILIVPVYNVGGMLNRNRFSRINQIGPEEKGFRGNRKNLDLNRDFIKADSKNALAFNRMFTAWDPDVFVDTHTTNGSDHTYNLSLITSQKDKLNPEIAAYTYDKLLPRLFEQMKLENEPIIPYVYTLNEDPEKGIKAFLETPRYSSGYAALFNTISFITEAHAYKSFEKRKSASGEFLKVLIEQTAKDALTIIESRRSANQFSQSKETFNLAFELDSSSKKALPFKGYQVKNRYSELLQDSIYYFDKSEAYLKNISFYDTYQATFSVKKPSYYAFAQAYSKVMERLKANKLKMIHLKKDTIIEVTAYKIKDYKSSSTPYEGHYVHSDVEITLETDRIQFYRGDILVSTNQKNVRYLVECLEPQSTDGFFTWNFFDASLQQKEWFSPFSFEPKADSILNAMPSLKQEYKEKMIKDSTFSKNNFQKLFFIYRNSEYFEKSAFRYPVYRIE